MELRWLIVLLRAMNAEVKGGATDFMNNALNRHIHGLYDWLIDGRAMNHRVKRQAVRGRAAARAFMAGLGSLLSISTPQASHYHPAPSAQAALRSDFVRIGRDMYVVVERERQNEKATR